MMEHDIQFSPIQNIKKIGYQIHQEIHENHISMKKNQKSFVQCDCELFNGSELLLVSLERIIKH